LFRFRSLLFRIRSLWFRIRSSPVRGKIGPPLDWCEGHIVKGFFIFPAYLLGRNPDLRLICASHTHDLAVSMIGSPWTRSFARRCCFAMR